LSVLAAVAVAVAPVLLMIPGEGSSPNEASQTVSQLHHHIVAVVVVAVDVSFVTVMIDIGTTLLLALASCLFLFSPPAFYGRGCGSLCARGGP
jgi:hypothetical protein